MAPRHEWEDLPANVRQAVEDKYGVVVKAESAIVGANNNLVATLHMTDGLVFCKGARADGPMMRTQRHEEAVNPWLPGLAPRLLWRVELEGWLLLGFEHVTGQHPDLSPGSPELPLVADLVTTLARELTPCPPIEVATLTEQWGRFAAWRRTAHNPPADLDPWARGNLTRLVEWERKAIDLVSGNSLLHTDLHSLNILLGEQMRVIDWAWSRKGAVWVDAAFLVIRLIAAGHTIEAAQSWADAIPVWDGVPDEARTAFAVAVTGLWERRMREDPQLFRMKLTSAARKWAQYRIG